ALSWTCLKNRSFVPALSALILCAYAAFAGACASSTDTPRVAGSAGAGESAAGNGGAGGELQSFTIAFVPSETVSLQPKESRELTVQTTPAGQFRIHFALVDGDDPVADAVLDANDVQTDAQGIAHVTLTAPSQPASFSVRASSPGAVQVRLGVSVSASGVTALLVQPSYTGQRQVTKWTATAQPGASCSELAGNPPSDGSVVRSAKPGAPLVLPIPINVPLAVTVRAGHYIGGCVNLPALSEVPGNQVLVYASDRPLNLAATNLSLSFGASDAHPAFDKLLQASARAVESALLGSAKNDVAALLDGMREAAPATSREAFDAARTLSAWETTLEGALGKNAARRLRDPAQRWMSAGLLALNAPDALVGKLTPLGSGATSGATFMLTAVGTATPSNAGFPGFFVAKWSADSSDTVLVGMELNWQPARLVTALAVAPALAEFPEASSIEFALALSVDCAQVGQVLLANGESPGSTAFASCDESCSANLCRSAVAAAWSNAQLSSGTQIDTMSVTASGAAQIGDDARATGLSGSWVGELKTDDATALVSGALSANASSL
ncbi:MAG TPA: hypothetical protein VGC79_20430, partial [Polyangiaceae bacterium]